MTLRSSLFGLTAAVVATSAAGAEFQPHTIPYTLEGAGGIKAPLIVRAVPIQDKWLACLYVITSSPVSGNHVRGEISATVRRHKADDAISIESRIELGWNLPNAEGAVVFKETEGVKIVERYDHPGEVGRRIGRMKWSNEDGGVEENRGNLPSITFRRSADELNEWAAGLCAKPTLVQGKSQLAPAPR